MQNLQREQFYQVPKITVLPDVAADGRFSITYDGDTEFLILSDSVTFPFGVSKYKNGLFGLQADLAMDRAYRQFLRNMQEDIIDQIRAYCRDPTSSFYEWLGPDPAIENLVKISFCNGKRWPDNLKFVLFNGCETRFFELKNKQHVPLKVPDNLEDLIPRKSKGRIAHLLKGGRIIGTRLFIDNHLTDVLVQTRSEPHAVRR